MTTVSKRKLLAHRIAYYGWHGEPPVGMYTDHLCRNRACCNPAHLEQVSPRENTLRGESLIAKRARQTHCIHGHSLEAAYVNKKGERHCRVCNAIKNRAYQARLRQARQKDAA